MPRGTNVRLIITGLVLLPATIAIAVVGLHQLLDDASVESALGAPGPNTTPPRLRDAPTPACPDPRPSGDVVLVPGELDNLPALGTMTRSIVERGTALVDVSTNLPLALLSDLLPDILGGKGLIHDATDDADGITVIRFHAGDGRAGAIRLAIGPCGARTSVTAELALR